MAREYKVKTEIQMSRWLRNDTTAEKNMQKRLMEQFLETCPKPTVEQQVLWEDLVELIILSNRVKANDVNIFGDTLDPDNPDDTNLKMREREEWMMPLKKEKREIVRQLQGNGVQVNVNSSVSDLLVALDKEKDAISS